MTDSNRNRLAERGEFWTLPWKRPVVTLLIAAIVVALAGFSASRLKPAANLDVMFNSEEPAANAMGHILRDFAGTEQLILLVSQREADRDRLIDFAHQLDAAIKADTEASKVCRRVTFGADETVSKFFQQIMVPAGLYYLDEFAFDQFMDRFTLSAMRQQMKMNEAMLASPAAGSADFSRQLLRDPLRLREFLAAEARAASDAQPVDAFVTADNRMLLIQIAGYRSTTDLEYANEMLANVQRIVEQVNDGSFAVQYTGGYAIATTAAESIRGDMIITVTTSILIVQLLFWLMYVRPWLLGVAILPVASGVAGAFGVANLIDMELTPLVAVLGGLMAGLGVDYCIHFLSHYAHQRREAGSVFHAIRATMRSVGLAIGGACVTSVIGFAAILTADAKALRDFATIGCLGLLFTLVASVTILPAVIAVFDRRKDALDRRELRLDPTPTLAWLAGRPLGSLAVATGILLLAASVLLSRGLVSFSTDLSQMHPHPNAAIEAQEVASERFGNTSSPIIVYLHADSASELVSLSHWVKRRLQTASVVEAGVVRSFGLADLIPSPDRQAEREAEIQAINVKSIEKNFHKVVEESIFAADAFDEFVTFAHKLLRPERPPMVADLRPFPMLSDTILPHVGADPNQALTFVWTNQPLWQAQQRDEVVNALRDALAGNDKVTVTGISVLSMHTNDSIRNALQTPLMYAMIAVVIWLSIWWRSPMDVLCAMLPVLFGGATVLAWMQLTGENLNMVNLIGFPLLIGIGVDDAIFMISSFRRHRSNAQSMLRAFGAGMHAILMTSMTTAAAFGSLAFTSTPAIQSLGRLLAIGVLACLVGTVLLLVPVLMLRSRRYAK